MTLGPAYNNLRLGWIELDEPTYTELSPFNVSGKVNIPITAPTVESEGIEVDIWNATELKLEPEDEDDFYYISVAFSTIAPPGVGNFVEISLEVNGVIEWCDAEQLIMPVGTEQCHGIIVPAKVDKAFVDNGGFLKVRTSAATDTFNWKLIINKTFNR